jgi:SWI/SNF-related matrix-associated actin-dependent regulator of chromatin subfamily A-like protein 1
MTTKLYKFQKAGVALIQKARGRTLLADDPGLGKTLQSLFWAWVHLPDDAPIVVVCPKTITEHWKREAAHHLGMRAVVLEHRKPPPYHMLRAPSNTVWVINYEILGSAHAQDRSWCKFLRRLKPRLVIGDEAHYLCNPAAKRTQWFRELIVGVRHVLLLTGTPMTNRPAELWSLLNILWPKKFPSFRRFGNRYCKPEFTPWGPRYVGANRLPELHRKLKRMGMIRRRTVDVLPDLPKMVRTVIPVDITGRREYRAAEKDFVAWLRKTHPNKAAKGRGLERKTKYGYLIRLVSKLKRKAVKEWIDNFHKNTDEKLVVFAHHRSVVEGLHEMYPGSAMVNGKVTGRKRQSEIDRFNNQEKCRDFFGNLKAAGTGWSAKRCGTSMIAELGWKPGDIVQASKRTHGLGRGIKGKKSRCYILVAKNTVEESVCKLIQKKQKWSDAALDGGEARDDMNVLDMLENNLLHQARKGRK